MSGTVRDRLAPGVGELVGSMKIYGGPMGGSHRGETLTGKPWDRRQGMPTHVRLALFELSASRSAK